MTVEQRKPPDPSLPARLREFHERLPLAGSPPNALLSLPDDRILYLAAILRDTPVPAPALSLDEWRAFRDLLKPHGVFPLLAYRLRAWPEGCRPPAEIMDHLNRIFLYAAARSMRAGRQIQVVVDALEGAGIPSVLLKGPALARTVYPDPALRQSTDIDLLVRPGDVLEAEKVLEGLGYHCEDKVFRVSQYEYHHQVFDPPGDGLALELHWALDAGFNLFPANWAEGVISRRIPLESSDLSCHTLIHTDHLLYLAFHNIFLHGAIRLDWMIDTLLMMMYFGEPSEWQKLVNLAFEHHILTSLELTVTSVDLWAKHTNTEMFLDVSTWPVPSDREYRLWKYATTRYTSPFAIFFLFLQGQPGLIEKFKYGCRFIVPPAPMMAMFRRSDSSLDIPLAHLRRWARIFRHI